MAPVRKIRILSWTIFGLLSIPYLMVYFHRVAPAVVADLLMSDFGISAVVLGNLSAIYFYVYTVMQLPAGILADSLGARATVLIGMLISGIGSFLFSITDGINLAYAGRCLIGIGVSVIFVSILKICGEWFPVRSFGKMSGLTLLIGNVGALLATTPLAFFVARFGWRITFTFVGIICIASGIIVFLAIRNSPIDYGLEPPNHLSCTASVKSVGDVLNGVNQVIRNAKTWPSFIVFFGIYGSLMSFQGVWGVPFFVQSYHIPRIQASNLLVAMALGLIVGCPAVGSISDYLRKRKYPLLVFNSFYICCWLALLLWPGGKPPLSMIPILLFGIGFFASGFIIVWSCAKEVNPSHLSGIAMGLTNMGGFLGAALMQPFMGYLLDRNWDGAITNGARYYSEDAYRAAFLILTVILIITSIIGVFIEETNARNLE